MDAATTLSLVSIVVAVLSLGVSAVLTFRQVRLSRHANHAAALASMYSELRDVRFHRNYDYVVRRLAVEHSPENGILDLPESAQAAIFDVAYYYQNLANLMHFGVLDEQAVLPLMRTRIVNLWAAIKPFVEVERRRPAVVGTISILRYLELYAEAARRLVP